MKVFQYAYEKIKTKPFAVGIKMLLLTLALISIGLTYYFVFYLAPEKCYFEKMGTWLNSENYSNIKRIPFKDHLTKIAVTHKLSGSSSDNVSNETLKIRASEAKAILQEYNLKDLPDNFSESAFIQMKTSYDYCGL